MQVKKQWLVPAMEQWAGSKLWKEYAKAVYFHPAYLAYMQSHISLYLKLPPHPPLWIPLIIFFITLFIFICIIYICLFNCFVLFCFVFAYLPTIGFPKLSNWLPMTKPHQPAD